MTVTWDAFPAKADLPIGGFDQARVISDGTSAWCFRSSQGHPVLVAMIPRLTEPPALDYRFHTLTDADTGDVWKVTPMNGVDCGCGSVLKRYTAEQLLASLTSV